MKLFIDTANIDHIREIHAWGVLDGVTTNPSLIAKSGRNFIEVVHEIAELVQGPTSAEVIAQDTPGMIAEGRMLAKVHKHIIVKVPLTPPGLAAVAALSAEGIRTNVTLCFSSSQALLAAKAGATYISPFVGRIDDISWDGSNLIAEIAEIYANDPDIHTQVLAASIRHPMHLVQAALAGSDVATVPYKVFAQSLKHPLTDIGNAGFLRDWESVEDKNIIGNVERFLASRG